MQAFYGVVIKLRLAGLVSSAVMLMASLAAAHEVDPAIADLTVEGGQLRLEVYINAEAYLAGIDLDAVADTDDVPEGADYDRLRALPPAALEARIRDRMPWLLSGLDVRAGTVPVPLRITEVSVPETGDLALPRRSFLLLRGPMPPGAPALTVGWGAGDGPLILRQQGVEAPFTGYVGGGERSPEIAVSGGGALGGWQSFATYIPVGFAHILPKGLDHILFVLGLFFLSLRLRPLIWQISAFTLAHTMTLALGALGWVVVPGSIVEPLIAASITYVAVENILSRGLSRSRPVVVFGFGLLHGLGFASVLEEFGLPQDQFIPALLGFNVGVELGQLTVIALAFLAVGVWFGRKPWYRARIAIPASGVIALVGVYWFVERVFL
ncbi:HupE / UreJ protein [Salinihabitans flavidus]|uniref:HupE / UreJ protein n=1 Tax=Salinihabitans flavidus TaxID=569882 RepID=A0A1H8NLE7_9RHOB|nr:HupE / UreJ protein [Salinihabitans flavidus]